MAKMATPGLMRFRYRTPDSVCAINRFLPNIIYLEFICKRLQWQRDVHAGTGMARAILHRH